MVERGRQRPPTISRCFLQGKMGREKDGKRRRQRRTIGNREGEWWGLGGTECFLRGAGAVVVRLGCGKSVMGLGCDGVRVRAG